MAPEDTAPRGREINREQRKRDEHVLDDGRYTPAHRWIGRTVNTLK